MSTASNPTDQPALSAKEEKLVEHRLQDHIEETIPWKVHIYVAKYPLPCCLFMLFWFVLCGIILLSAVSFSISYGVPFYDRSDASRTYQDALVAGKKDAIWTRKEQTDAHKQQQAAASVTLQLIYKVKDSDTLMTKEFLDIMDEIESKINSRKDYNSHCLRIYNNLYTNGTCARQTSLTNFFDPSFFKPSLDRNYTRQPSFIPNFVNYLVPSSFIDATKTLANKTYDQDFIDSIVSYWASYDKGEGSAQPYAQKWYHETKMPPKFYYQTQPQGTPYSVSNMFAALSDKHFAYDTPLDLEVEAATSIFTFGLPLKGYDDAVNDVAQQQDDIGKWCYDNLQELFVDFADKYEDKLDFYWSCSSMAAFYTEDIMGRDLLFMIVTFASVFLLMINGTGSIWLSTCGMAMIFLNFLPSILLYRLIAQQTYFGTLQLMAMFIILSIGADDIFVLVDTYAQYRTAAPNAPIDKRLTATLKHAGKVMATTSASTCFSFLANTTSVFPAVYTFGAFAAILVFVNYCAVVLFYPTVLAVHETYFFVPQLKRSCCITKKCANNKKKVDPEDDDYERTNINENTTEEKTTEEETKRGIDAFFENKFYPFVVNQRRRILGLTLVIFLVFFAFGVRIQADPEPPQFYPKGNNYQEYRAALTDNFASETGLQLTVNIVWGINGINREKTDPTIVDDIGRVIYSSNLSFIAPEEQEYIAQFCDDLLCVHSDYQCRYSPSTYYDLQIADPAVYGAARTNVVQCFMTEFREWVLSDPTANPNDTDVEEAIEAYGLEDKLSVDDFEHCEYQLFPVQDTKCFGLLFAILWLNDEMPTSNPDYTAGKTNYDYWKTSLYGKATDDMDGFDLKFFIVKVLTEASLETIPADGIQLFHDWQTFGDHWRDNEDGQHTVDMEGNAFVETPDALKSIMITDPFLFSYYFVQKQIISEAVFGIALSLVLAFIVLSLATGNWLIAMYSCCVIFVIVICVVGFTVMSGWKLGVIEAVIYVMVVGMSVDYVVHLSEAYLSSGKYLRTERAQRMLGMIGGSVLSGAISTLLGIVWLLLATNYIFYKFGALIFFLIATSCIMSLFSFTAAMSAFGPEGTSGDLWLSINRCWTYLNGKKTDSAQSNDTSSRDVENKLEMSHAIVAM